MKNIIIKFILTVGLLAGYHQAGATDIEVRMPDTTGVKGNTIDVPVYVDNSLTGQEVYSYQFSVSFNAYRLEFVEITVSGTISEDWGVPMFYPNNQIVTVANAGGQPLEGTGPLFFIRFEMINTGASNLNFSGGTQSNFFNQGEPVMILQNGSVGVVAPPSITISPDYGLIAEGGQLQFSVSGGTAPYTWSVTNPAVASIDNDGLLTGTDQGLTKVVAADDAGITDTINGFVEIRVAEIYVPDTSAYQGEVFDLPVYVTDLTDEGIVSGSFGLQYGAAFLEAIGFNKAGTLLESFPDPAMNVFAGGLEMSFAGSDPLTGSGVLIYITFQVTTTNTSGTNVTPADVLFNENLPGIATGGYFDVIPLPSLTITPNAAEIVAGEELQFSVAGATMPVTWSSSDPSVAGINGDGLLTAYHSGVIQVSAVDAIGASGTSGDISVYDTYVTIQSGNAPVGTVYDLPVTMGDLPAGEEVFSMQGKIIFQIPELSLVDIVTDGTLSQGWSKSVLSAGNTVTFALASATSFNSAGTLFYLRFQLTPELSVGETAYVNFDVFTMNEGVPLPMLMNGGITASEGVPATQNLSFAVGWGGISSYVVPDDTDIENLFAPATAVLDILYDQDGNIYQPAHGVNTIGNWNTQKAYVLKLSGPATVLFDGYLNFNRTISLGVGWNLIPVISECPVAVTVLAGSIPGFDFLQEVAGTGIYWPAFGINTIGDLQPGKAYYLHTATAGSFTFPLCPKE